MRVYVDLDSRAPVVSPTLLQRVTTLYFTRRDNVPLEVVFVQSGVVVELASGATGAVGVKSTYAGSMLASDSAWTKTGTGTSAIYSFGLDLNTVALDALFPLDTEDSVDAKIEISWTADGLTSSTLPTVATIYNDVLRGDEGAALATATASGFHLAAPGGTIYAITVGDDGVLSTTVDGAVTSAPSGLAMRSADLTVWTLAVGNDGTLSTTAT
jgi:hypothetical protein